MKYIDRNGNYNHEPDKAGIMPFIAFLMFWGGMAAFITAIVKMVWGG